MNTLRLGPFALERFQVPFIIPLLDIRKPEHSTELPMEQIAALLGERNHVLMRVESDASGTPEVSMLLDEWVIRAGFDRMRSDERTDSLFLYGARRANAGHKVEFLQRSHVVEVAGWHVGAIQSRPDFSEERCQALTEVLRRIYDELEGLPVGAQTRVEQDLETRRTLEELFGIVEVEQELELEKQRGAARATYISVQPDMRARTTSRITYRFGMAAEHDLEENEFVEAELKNGEKVSGEVVDVDDGVITVGFRRQFNFEDLVTPGLLVPSLNETQYRVRKNVLVGLSRETTPATYLLSLLAKNEFPEPLSEGGITNPPERLTPSQRRGVTVGSRTTGVVLIQGPPGTGKTTVIQEWVEHFVRNGQKVLISSQSNMAVDNVLERFLDKGRSAEDLGSINVVRVGHEDKVATSVHGALLDNRARDFQAIVMERSHRAAQPFLAHRELVDDLLLQGQRKAELSDRLLRETNALGEARERLRALELEASGRAKSVLDAEIVAGALTSHRDRLLERYGSDILEERAIWLFQPLKYFRQKKLQNVIRELTGASARLEHVRQGRDEGRRLVDEARHTVKQCETAVRDTKLQLNKIDFRSRNMVRFSLHPLSLPSGFRPDWSNVSSPDAVDEGTLAWASRMKGVLDVIDDWHELLQDREGALYRLVLQFVDVVGGTCVGINSNRQFSEIDFGVTIIDEAGQIPVHDIMVPLSRSPRAIMVGDHLQLPPVVQDVMESRLEEAELDVDLVKKSLFERLYDIAPDSAKIMLDTQFRMPGEIADFISDQFYGGAYKSHESKRGLAPLLPAFKRPFVVVDTSQRRDRMEGYDGQSYRNVLEANLIGHLTRYALRNGLEVDELGIIAPYKAQARYIYELLTSRYGLVDEAGVLKDNVATVDAFQGQERDLIIYSFTRSNNNGRIGFLRELRRLNVALTRPKKQLVIFGDFSTLQRAEDETFARMAADLVEAARTTGEYLSVEELRERIVARKTSERI